MYSSDQIKKNEMGRTSSTYGERISAYRVLVGKRDEGRPFGRPRCRWQNNIITDTRDAGRGHGLD